MTGVKKHIHFLSASDRINYGDLLFPILFDKVAKKMQTDINFHNYSIVKSNLFHFGALPTMSYLRLQENIKIMGGNLIVGGGEVLFANWRTLYAFINPIYVRLSKNKYFRKIDKRFRLSNFLLSRNKVEVPFCPSKAELENSSIKIFFSSVGGGFWKSKLNANDKRIVKTLQESSLLSVRDERTFNSLKKVGLASKLIPDSAIIMSDFYGTKSFQSKRKKDYIFLQIGKNKAPNNLRKFSEGVRNLSKTFGLDVVLCPIGLAPNHEDDVVLKKIQSHCFDFTYVHPKNLEDIMGLIAHSSLYMGTSLHGAITAQSFEVPFVGLNKRIAKLDSYIKTWVDKTSGCIGYDELEKVVAVYENWNFDLQHAKLKEQKVMVYENLKHILNEAQ